MEFKIIYPINAPIYGNSFQDGVKNFVKLNHNMGLSSLILADQEKRYKINLRYYKEDTRNRVGFDVFPIKTLPIGLNLPQNINNFRFWNPTASNNLFGLPYTVGVPFTFP